MLEAEERGQQLQLAVFEDCVWLRTTLFSADNGSQLGIGILVFPREILNLKVLAVPPCLSAIQRSGQLSVTHTFPSQPPYFHQHLAEH